MPLISAEQTRPPSEQLVDLHVYLVPTSSWNEQYRSVFNQAVNQTISAGFVRAHPEDHLYKLRDDVEEQLGSDIIPEEYVFLRSVGRCLTQVKGKQELILKVKNFLPPYNFSAEIFVLKSKREPVPLPDINRSKEHLLERKYSRTEGTQTTQSTNSGYHSDDWSANHVKPKSTDFSMSNQHSVSEPRKALDKSGWRDTYTNGTNEDSGIAEPTPEEDLGFHQQHHNLLESSEVIDQHSDNGNMIVLHHNQEEPHRTEQRRRFHDDDNSSKAIEEKTVHDFQMNYEKFLEDEENRKELENLQLMREQNAQNVADVRRKKEEMQRAMSRRARELASQNSHDTKQYQVNEIEPYEGSSFASKEVSQYEDITGHDNIEPEHLMDEQRDLNQESWSDGQPSTLTEKELLQKLRKNEAEKNRMALEAIQIEDSAKEHSFLKKGKKKGISSVVEKQHQDTPSSAEASAVSSRPGHQTNQPNKNKDCNQLLLDLEEMREQRLAIEQRREDLVRKAKTLQSRTQDRRNKAPFGREGKDGSLTRDYWKKQYFEEKKLTNPLEDHINKLRQQVEQAHRKLITMMEGRMQAKKIPPSQKNNHKINIAKSQHDLEDLRRRVENAKMRLTSEMKLRNQAEKELRNLKNELTQKKIHVTLTRSQQLAILKESEETLLSSRTPQPHRTSQPRKTPVVPTQISQSLTSRP
ncbi:spermatogenesis-associated protein 1-like isoform X9 [Anneissia japonica]|uniref:spermatogenesis-associated protein 1-like isoform X9 n=1 Tax=Anneissia japonica TaxID=1529436 RepID=UPI001425A98F|nr:spermatogenesis-associated protein 1-like isoform X9 [Anneissia japonica]